MDFIIFWIAFLIIGSMIAIYSFFYSKKAKFKRKLKTIPLKRIRDFKDGYIARFVGEVKGLNETLESPLTKRKCVYYEVIIQEKRSTGKSSHWETIINDTRHVPFAIDDDGDLAIISNDKLKGLLVTDKNFKTSSFNEPSEELKNYIQSHGKSNESWLGFNKTLRYKEGVFEIGEPVTAYGQGRWTKEFNKAFGLSDSYHLHITPTHEDPIYVSDDPDIVSLKDEVSKSYR